MKKIFYGVCLLFFVQVSFAQKQNNLINLSHTEMLQDYEFMLQTLENSHPNLFAYISKEEFEKTTNSLKLSIHKNTQLKDFYIILLKTISLVHQGHTMLFSDLGFSEFLQLGGSQFPFKIAYYNNHIYVSDNYSLIDTLAIGSEIISINNIPITTIIEDFKPLLRTRPNGSIGKELSMLWSRYLWLNYGESGNYTIDFIKPYGNKIERRKVYGINNKSRKNTAKTNQENSFHFNKPDNTAILSLNTFFLDYQELDSVLYNGFKSISTQNIENLIIDIRSNNGGNSNLIGTLMDYIIDKPYSQVSKSEVKTSEAAEKCFTTNPIFINAIEQARIAEKDSEEFNSFLDCYLNNPYGTISSIKQKIEVPTENKKYRYKGQLYVLTSNYTFSAATAFAAIIKDYSLGTIIGEETSDNPTGYGSIILFELPNSKVLIQNSTEYTVRPAGFDDEHGVIPHNIVNKTSYDLITGYDRIMDYALWMIKNNYP